MKQEDLEQWERLDELGMTAMCGTPMSDEEYDQRLQSGASTFGTNIIIRRHKPYYMVSLKKSICRKWMLPLYLRLGTMNLKIASITLGNNAILLTRNSSDFGQIVDLRIDNCI